MNEKLIKTFLKDDINFIISRECDFTDDITGLFANIICEVAIKNNKNVLLITNTNDDLEEKWYMSNLISLITNLDVGVVFNSYQMNQDGDKISNSKKFVNALEMIQNSNLNINLNACDEVSLLNFLLDEKNKHYDLIIINDLSLLCNDSYFSNKKYINNRDLIHKDAVKFLSQYAKKYQAKILCAETSITGSYDSQFFKDNNIIYVKSIVKGNKLYHFLSNSDLIILDNTNKIIKYMDDDYLIKDTMSTLKKNSEIIVINNLQIDIKYINLILDNYLFLPDNKIKFYSFEDSNNIEGPELLDMILDLESIYDYIIINDFKELMEKIHMSYEKVLRKLYDFAKRKKIKFIILADDNELKENKFMLVDTYMTLQMNNYNKISGYISNKNLDKYGKKEDRMFVFKLDGKIDK